MTDPTTTGEEPMGETDRELASLLRENSDPDEDPDSTRRGFLGALVAGVATVAGLAGYGVGQAEAATPAGDVGTAANPFETGYFDTVNWKARTTDPSSPADGTEWFNENA